MRRTETTEDVIGVLGSAPLASLRKLLLASELFALAKDLALVEGRLVFQFLRQCELEMNTPGDLTIKLASAALGTLSKDLEAANKEQERYYTEAKERPAPPNGTPYPCCTLSLLHTCTHKSVHLLGRGIAMR